MRVILAGLVYAALCLAAGALLGPVREALEPVIGETGSAVWEGALLLIAIFFSAKIAAGLLGQQRAAGLLAMGFEAFVLVAVADFLLGWLARDMSLEEQVRAFGTTPGLIYGCLLLTLIVMPTITGAFASRENFFRSSDAAAKH